MPKMCPGCFFLEKACKQNSWKNRSRSFVARLRFFLFPQDVNKAAGRSRVKRCLCQAVCPLCFLTLSQQGSSVGWEGGVPFRIFLLVLSNVFSNVTNIVVVEPLLRGVDERRGAQASP